MIDLWWISWEETVRQWIKAKDDQDVVGCKARGRKAIRGLHKHEADQAKRSETVTNRQCDQLGKRCEGIWRYSRMSHRGPRGLAWSHGRRSPYLGYGDAGGETRRVAAMAHRPGRSLRYPSRHTKNNGRRMSQLTTGGGREKENEETKGRKNFGNEGPRDGRRTQPKRGTKGGMRDDSNDQE
jgi:hypothetical protein